MQNARLYFGFAFENFGGMRTGPQFEITREARLGVWADDLAALLARSTDAARVASLPPFRSVGSSNNQLPANRGRGLAASLFVHACVFVLLSRASLAAPAHPQIAQVEASDPAPIYLDLKALKELKILRALPVVKPAGAGGRPGIAARPAPILKSAVEVPQASTAQNPKFTIVVNPLKAENRTQAIHQALAPPDLKIQGEQHSPDILLDDDPGPTAPKPQVDLEMQTPTLRKDATNAKALPAPAIAPNAPQLPMKLDASVPQPKMPASYFASDSLRAPHDAAAGAAGARKDARADAPPNPSGGIVVLSAQPAAFSQLAALAQGNRVGALAVAPSKPGPGSPGGKPTGTPAPGANGTGSGGDASVGVGPGNSGGGGGAALSASATLSAVGGSGKSGGVDANGLLAPALPAAVFPVTIATSLRRAPLVISTGPMGGGGLDIYGALKCGKVYSIFLPMPGKNWALQYCAHATGALAAAKPTQPSGGAVRLGPGIVPPVPDQQFDFRRLPLPDKDSDKLIVLQGAIGADGAVSDARVFRGVLPEMDTAATQAFSKWKFKPATRSGAALALDVLVGIPAKLPENANAASTAISPAHGR